MSQEDMAQLWRKLTDGQRTYLMNQLVPYRHQQVKQPYYIATSRAIERHGLSRGPSPRNRALAEWAIERGYALQDGPSVPSEGYRKEQVASWTFQAPRARRIDPERLAELVAEGLSVTAIAARFGVTRAAVYFAVKRHGLTKPIKPVAAEFRVRLATELHRADCGCSDFGDPLTDEDDRYIRAVDVALARAQT